MDEKCTTERKQPHALVKSGATVFRLVCSLAPLLGVLAEGTSAVTMIPIYVYVLLGVVALAYAGDYAFSFFDDPSEPPRVHSRIPLVGHLIGFLTKGTGYYDETRLAPSFQR